ncbi:MAG: radical SAM protein [Rhodobiaceae bacterium]|nr:MAG: radical SAM protein [Rhodobiaceae bacterium]
MNVLETLPGNSRTKIHPFTDPRVTAKGEPRAHVALRRLETLWFNTGTLCNIECVNCYIESSPKNDRLVYLTPGDVSGYLDEIERDNLGTGEIGFTGGEPFMNPHMGEILENTLDRGYDALVLTNAMQPMLRPAVREQITKLVAKFKTKLTFRVSLDHHTAALHNKERGPGAFEKAMEGLSFLSEIGAQISIAGRTCWGESDASERQGYGALFVKQALHIDPNDPMALTLFPEMDAHTDVPEITTSCWSILNVDPHDMMCSNSRMVVKHKGADAPTVAACTLLPYDDRFDLGASLAEASSPVSLNHHYCAQFCVLGGGSCSA